jgi:hypothetical protein
MKFLDHLLDNRRVLHGLGTAFIVVLMAYSGYSVLRANIAPFFAYACFFPAALFAPVIAFISGFGREERIAELPPGLHEMARTYNVIASALLGTVMMMLFGLLILPLVMIINWVDDFRG